MKLAAPKWEAPRALRQWLIGLSVLGAVTVILGLFLAPQRVLSNLLLSGYYVLTLGLGALFFVAIKHVSRAGWSTAIRRVPEAVSSLLMLAAVLLAGAALGSHELYEWTHHDVVAADPVLSQKTGWLNLPFFALRAGICFLVWIGFARALVAHSRRQDADRDLGHTVASWRLSAVFLVLFALTFSVAAFDWVMSLEPHWFSTIFAVYNFAGLFEAAIAVIAIVVIAMRRVGPLRGIATDDHLHDLGKLLFAFSVFWAYIWFSQFMLIWYSNIPEETVYFARRLEDGWMTLFVANVALNWLVPFLLLLPRPAKRNEKTLLRVAMVVLVGHWLDLYIMILRPALGASPAVNVWEVLPFAGAIAAAALVVLRALGAAEPVPVGDPTLAESLHHHA